jgi:hypothetical protein
VEVEGPTQRQGGRRPRYGVRMRTIHMSFPLGLLRRINEQKALRQASDPEGEWSASRVVVEDIAKLYGFDLSPQEP